VLDPIAVVRPDPADANLGDLDEVAAQPIRAQSLKLQGRANRS
jgi:hypothetical protein